MLKDTRLSKLHPWQSGAGTKGNEHTCFFLKTSILPNCFSAWRTARRSARVSGIGSTLMNSDRCFIARRVADRRSDMSAAAPKSGRPRVVGCDLYGNF